MYYNGAICDIYIGKGAGTKLMKEISRAKNSIKIVSPYLSPSLIKELIDFHEKNIDIELVTTDDIEDFQINKNGRSKNIHKLIIQNRVVDDEAVKKREEWLVLKKVLNSIGWGLFTSLFLSGYYLRNINVFFGLLPVFFIFLIAKIYKRKIKLKRIYSYWYSQLFPFKVYLSPRKNYLSDTFIHSKIYLIDDKIAYLGSLNFTASGTKHNYETRIRTEDPKAIHEIKEEISHLLNHSHLPEIDIQMWGKQLYREPIN